MLIVYERNNKMNDSKKIIKGLALGTALAIGTVLPTAIAQTDNPYLRKKIVYDNNIESYENRNRIDFYNYLQNIDMSEYDEVFVNLYRKGKVNINDIMHNLDDLFIEVGMQNNERKILLVSCRNPEYDILTGMKKENFIREDILILKKSTCFYQVYQYNKQFLDKNILIIQPEKMQELQRIIYTFDGSYHNMTPELNYKFKK